MIALAGALLREQVGIGAAVVATGLVAVMFDPLRNRLQRGVNRLLYGERDDPATAVARLARRLEGTAAPEAVLPGVVDTVAQALRLPYVAIEVQQDGRLQRVAVHGSRPVPRSRSRSRTTALRSDSSCSGCAGDDGFSPEDSRVLSQIWPSTRARPSTPCGSRPTCSARASASWPRARRSAGRSGATCTTASARRWASRSGRLTWRAAAWPSTPRPRAMVEKLRAETQSAVKDVRR